MGKPTWLEVNLELRTSVNDQEHAFPGPLTDTIMLDWPISEADLGAL